MVHIEVTVNDGIPDFLGLLDIAVDQGIGEGSMAVRDLAKTHVRKDTGSLDETIDAEPVIDEPGHHEWSVNAGNVQGGYKGGGQHESGKGAGAPVDYALDQEYGLQEGAFTPFMTPASEEGWPAVQTAVRDAILGLTK